MQNVPHIFILCPQTSFEPIPNHFMLEKSWGIGQDV